jgi:hypothetical protein
LSDLFRSTIVHAQYVRQEAQQQQTLDHIREAILNRAPNYKHADGRIYASNPSETYYAVTVSPSNPKFRSQIEDGVFPVVEALLNKNYLPISSCEGHGTGQLFVKVSFGTKESAEKFIAAFGVVEDVVLDYSTAAANVTQQIHHNRVTFERKQVDEYIGSEVMDTNMIYNKDYKQVFYVDIILYKRYTGILEFIKRHFASSKRTEMKPIRVLQIVQRLQELDYYEL